ncbi:MAG TPA: chromosome segregation protein SMC [Trueperaceae bacterium]|nr:chromosome segregation protein SMC [Trueperaceae bacterium]
MRLTSLSLQGFKSFGNRTAVEFAPGVTGIIGPNGSGKSNLIDALKWTTGGGRAREFRAADKRDLIFHGASGKRSVGLAEVEVELSGDGRAIKLYRSLDRDGATRLKLNGRNARFLDLEEALAGSGLGRTGVAIIGQGEVSQVLIADPPKLLEYVAEAAGVGRMSARREQTVARLETARGHLDRLQDVLVELEERCEALTAEAAEAERHARSSAEALRLRVTAARRRVEGLEGELRGLGERRGELEAAIVEGRTRLAELRREQQAARRERDGAEERYRKALADAEVKRGDLRVAQEQAARAAERRDAVASALAAAREEAARLEAADPPSAPEGDAAPLVEREAALAGELERSSEELARAREASGEAAEALERERRAQADAQRQRAAFETRAAELERQSREATERLAALEQGAGPELAALAAASAAAEGDAATHATALEEARRALAAAHERHAGLEAESQALARAAQRQQAAFEARRSYAQGPRNALVSGIPGIRGSVGDLLRVPERFRVAIGAALGRRAEYVVVDDADTGRRVLEHVRERGGFVTVLPLDLLEPGGRRVPAGLLGRDGVVGAAVDVVEVDPAYRIVAEQLLGGTLLVEDMARATALVRGGGPRARLVALGGDILETSGAMSGGRRMSQGSVLGAAAEVEEAQTAAARAADAAAEARAELERRQAAVRGLQAREPELRQAAERARHALAEAREAASRRDALLEDLRARRAAIEEAIAALEAPAEAPDAARLEALEAGARAASERLERLREAVSARREELGEVRQGRLVLEERWRSYRQARERFEEGRARAAELRTQAGRQEQALEELERQLQAARAAVEAAEAALPTGLEEAEAALAAARERDAGLDVSLSQETELQAARGQELEAANVQRARREAALELAQEELQGFPEGASLLELSERAARARLREVEADLEALGPVNHRAARDLQETRERKESLEVEAVQGALAVTELEGTLLRIDRETNARLETALGRLRSAFQAHVEQLFGSEGAGDIEVEHEDGRPVGVRIKLQPPGKQTQSLHLLSVGERTMGALAFLFALMTDDDGAAGLPIAVLDEVDAPLDEANIRRYCAFVSRLARAGTQFVLITHQKATFEVADVLWGVTTEEGVSRVFSIRREDAVPQA